MKLSELLEEISKAVDSARPVSPTEWIDWGIKLTRKWLELKDEMTKAYMMYKAEVSDLIEQGKKVSEADRIVEGKSEAYRMYLYLKGRDVVVEEMIRLCKKKAMFEINMTE